MVFGANLTAGNGALLDGSSNDNKLKQKHRFLYLQLYSCACLPSFLYPSIIIKYMEIREQSRIPLSNEYISPIKSEKQLHPLSVILREKFMHRPKRFSNAKRCFNKTATTGIANVFLGCEYEDFENKCTENF